MPLRFKPLLYIDQNGIPNLSYEKRLLDIQHNVVDDPFGWRFKL